MGYYEDNQFFNEESVSYVNGINQTLNYQPPYYNSNMNIPMGNFNTNTGMDMGINASLPNLNNQMVNPSYPYNVAPPQPPPQPYLQTQVRHPPPLPVNSIAPIYPSTITPLNSNAFDLFEEKNSCVGSSGHLFKIYRSVEPVYDSSITTDSSVTKRKSITDTTEEVAKLSKKTKKSNIVSNKEVVPLKRNKNRRGKTTISKKRVKELKKRDRRLILVVLKGKKLIKNESICTKQIALSCTNNPTIDYHGRVFNVRLKDPDTDIDSIEMKDVMWEVLVEKTNDMKIDFTSKQLLEAIRLTHNDSTYSLVLFPKKIKHGLSEKDSEKKKLKNDKASKSSNRSDNKTKKESENYCGMSTNTRSSLSKKSNVIIVMCCYLIKPS